MAVSSQQRLTVVKRGLDLIGTPYLWAGEDKKGVDCSGVAIYAWKGLRHFPYHQSGAMVTAPGVRSVAAGEYAQKVDSTGRHASSPVHGPLRWPMHWLRLGDLVWYYGQVTHPATISHVALYVGAVSYKGKDYVHGVINATGIVDGVNRGVELIEIDAYTPRTGFGYIEH